MRPGCVMRASLWPAGQRCILIQQRVMDRSPTGCSNNSSLMVDAAGGGETYRQWGFAWSCSARLSPCSPPARRLSSGQLVLTCFPAAKMTDLAHRTRFQQDAVWKVYGTASVLTDEVGFFSVKVQNETQPPVRFRVGCSLLAVLVPDRYALLKNVCPKLNTFILHKPKYRFYLYI